MKSGNTDFTYQFLVERIEEHRITASIFILILVFLIFPLDFCPISFLIHHFLSAGLCYSSQDVQVKMV